MSKPDKKRKIIFTILTFLIPVIFFLFLELFFTIFNLFPQQPLFIEDGNIVKINSNVGERYFNRKIMPVPNLYPQTFQSIKKENTFRIFCLGGSTTAGFPYEMTVPFPKQLEIMLRKDYPSKNIEVVNLGLSAVNSFTVLDWVPDILKQEPDLIIIYMGHNEFYGAYGTGSTISISNNAAIVRFVMKLRHYRTTQMLLSIINTFVTESSDAQSTTVMEKIVSENFIAADSELRQITLQNYSDNLELILNECVNNNTPVILSNLVSNLKDQKPLDSYNSNPEDSSSALYFYNAALGALANNDSLKAYLLFSEARDRDGIPFRASSELSKVIKMKSEEFKSAFVDMNNAFRYFSPGGTPGDNLFCDHLHPNPMGYRIMANEFRNAIAKKGFLPEENQKKTYSLTPEIVTGLDWEIGGLKIYKLKHSWPFGNERVNYGNYIPITDAQTVKTAKSYLFDHHTWGRAHEEMAEYYKNSGNFEQACIEYLAIVEIYPEKINFYTKLINCAKKINAWKLVQETSLKALVHARVKGEFYYDLAFSDRVLGNVESALSSLRAAIKSEGSSKDQMARYHFTYVSFLLDAGRVEAAREAYQDFITLFPDYPPAKGLEEKINNFR